MNKIEELLQKNKQWSRRVTADDPDFFSELADQQNPDFLWIGCSDSRVSANTIVGLMPGEVFVHRNVANLVYHTDVNCLSVLQFAVEVLQVDHIIVCGHYGCGGIRAAMEEEQHGLIDNWLRHIRVVANLHQAELAEIEDEDERLNRLAEINVAEQVLNVAETTVVSDAWLRGQKLAIHGWIYGLKDGIIRDLNKTIADKTTLEMRRNDFLFNNKRQEAGRAS